MSNAFQSRRAFIALSEDIFRELGFAPPEVTHDPEAPLEMSLERRGVPFTLVHSPDQHSASILIETRLGALPPDGAIDAMVKLLHMNRALFRARVASMGINEDNGEMTCRFLLPLREAHAGPLLARIDAAADYVAAWRDGIDIDSIALSPDAHAAGSAQRDVWRVEFGNLVDALHALIGKPAPEAQEQLDGAIAVTVPHEGRDHCLVQTGRTAELLTETPLGSLPESNREDVLRRLLEMNHSLANVYPSSFGLDANGEPIFLSVHDIYRIDAAMLLESLGELNEMHIADWDDFEVDEEADDDDDEEEDEAPEAHGMMPFAMNKV